MELVDDKKLRVMLEGPDGLCSKASEVDSEVGWGVCQKAAAVLLEINKYGGEPDPIFNHGYVHEKVGKLFKAVDDKSPWGKEYMEELVARNKRD